MPAALLSDRGVLAVSGADAPDFLGRLVTSAVDRLETGKARFGALLTPQGKIIADFIVVRAPDGFYLDVAADRLEALSAQLARYRLRAKVDLIDASDQLSVLGIWGDTPVPAASVADPRLPGIGARAYVPPEEAEERADTDAETYHAGRIALGLPEGGKDYPWGETFPHEADLDLLGGIDFDKGCYIGQEVVSRMEHRGTARSRVVPVRIAGDVGEAFTDVHAGERLIGSMGSSSGVHGLALLRLDRVAEAVAAGLAITCGDAVLTVLQPSWASFEIAGAVTA